MKKYLKFLLVAFVATMTLSLSSCKSDDDEPSTGSIVGSWQVESSVNEVMESEQYLQFRSDGTFYEVINYTDEIFGSMLGTVYDEGTWSLSGNNLKVSVKNDLTVKKVTSTELVLEENVMGYTVEVKCKKVSDEIVNELLENATLM